jgi:pyrroloquinoline quinone biosynthesis protein B
MSFHRLKVFKKPHSLIQTPRSVFFTYCLFVFFGSLVSPDLSAQNRGAQIIVLGIAQDAGYPQLACKKECCQKVFDKPSLGEKVVSLAIFQEWEKNYFLLEASPDINVQHQYMQETYHASLDGVFVSHAHIGHYTGLMYLGKEAANVQQLPLYLMPRMKNYLEQNAPWEALFKNGNLKAQAIRNHDRLPLGDSLSIQVFKVPHRDEYSETIGYRIEGPNKKAIFIPDIDKWQAWEVDIRELIKEVDYALLDATFYDANEIPGRDLSSIPHPFVTESMDYFANLSKEDKSKIYFIHLNHTNPLINPESSASKKVQEAGFNIARENLSFQL